MLEGDNLLWMATKNNDWRLQYKDIQSHIMHPRIIETQSGLDWKGLSAWSGSNHSAMGRDIFLYTRLLKVQYSLTLNTSRESSSMGTCHSASLPSQKKKKLFFISMSFLKNNNKTENNWKLICLLFYKCMYRAWIALQAWILSFIIFSLTDLFYY